MLLLAAAGLAAIAIVATVGILVTGAFRSRTPTPEALREKEKAERRLRVSQAFPADVVRKLLGDFKPANKSGAVATLLKGKTIVVSAEIVDDTVRASAEAFAKDFPEKMTGTEEEPWKSLFPEETVKRAKLDTVLTIELPDDRWPEQVSDVGTVVWIRWWKQAVGAYQADGAFVDKPAPAASNSGEKPRLAYQWFVAVAVLDRATSAVRDVKIIAGDAPPAQLVADAAAGSGRKPTSAVRDYLLGLPRE